MSNLTRDQARKLVEARLASMPALPEGDTLVIRDEATIERPFGWVFCYDSKLYRDTGDFRYAIAGNARFIVNKQSGEVVATGTARPISEYIAEYEANSRHAT